MDESDTNVEAEFLSPASVQQLNIQQRQIFGQVWQELIEYLRTRGKSPDRHEGYENSSVRPIARRIFQVFAYVWATEAVTFEISRSQANHFLEELNRDTITTDQGCGYNESSKRKISDALRAYFRFRNIEWDPPIGFSDEDPILDSDPFTRTERERLFSASLEYNSPPKYKNVDPDERDRWNTYLAQELGKLKEKIGPSDWKELRRSWKIPSLLSASLDCGLRAALVGGLTVGLVDLDTGQIRVPPDVAVKNNQEWIIELSKRSNSALGKWIDQRDRKTKYDDSSHIWLNRKGNPYESGTLNTLLDNLMETAEIDRDERRLTWHSIRHSTGMYVYNQEQDLELVAEILRQKSLAAAKRYAHPTPETKRDVIESIQRGGQ